MMITTIITTFRRPLLLKRAINSVLKQTHSDFQVCVYDNASDDQTEEIVKTFLKKDSRVKYHRHQENIGMMSNYKYAFDKIDTPFFSLLSDDDFLLPNFYETALKGFEQSPDAAFSACGVVQMDELGNFAGDPLASWRSEGYYAAQDGLVEMVSARAKFPIPTGVLFQTKAVQDTKPNYCEDLDFFWDPDYLMRIAARHPITISKKRCAVYFAHSQCFAPSFYSKLLNDFAVAEKYLRATKVVLQGIEDVQGLQASKRRAAIRFFNNYVKQDVIYFIKCYIVQRKLGKVHLFCNRYYHHYGLSLSVLFYHLSALIIKGWSLFLSFLKPSKARKISNLDVLKDCYEYGQKLLEDDS